MLKKENSRSKCPFWIGQLVKEKYALLALPARPPKFFLVLDIEWSYRIDHWKLTLLSQQTGKTQWYWSHGFGPVGGKDDET